MAVNPAVIRAEAHEQLGRLILDEGGEVIRRWQQRALQEQPTASRAHRAALIDHLPDLLAAIAERLRSDGESASDSAGLADRHGEQRWETGWSLSEVVRDYQILRLVLLDIVEESLGRPLATAESMAIGLELDDAIMRSVDSYARHSEEAIRAGERQKSDRDRLMREAMEQGLVREAEDLKTNDRRKDEFLALLGHELRNPLGAMANAWELTQLLPPSDPDYQQAAGVLQRQLRQMERLVDDLLDISRITRGVIDLRREETDLVAMVRDAADAIRPMAERRRHQLELQAPPTKLLISADPSRLQQILTNLLANAIKYTPPGGKIVFAAEAQGAEAVVRVQDNGIGILPDLLPHIFDMFMRAELTARHSDSGLGLGLTLVRNLVSLHGGAIEAFSDGAGKGSRFIVRFPLAERAQDPKPPERPLDSPAASRARVLVVDDNQDVAMTLAALVRHSGHEVRLAYDGPAALELAKDYRPDLILVDIGLPGMNGYEVARKLRGELGLTQSLLAALTGYGQEEDRRRSVEAGFDQHLIKPIRPETLTGLLSAADRGCVRSA
jgi:signal transduction histidine kinase/CheY-like chemotaxis protein